MIQESIALSLAIGAFVYAAAVRQKLSNTRKTTLQRLVWALPALATLILTPLLYDPRKAGTLLGVHGWSFSWVGTSKIVAVVIGTSPLPADVTALQFVAHLLFLCMPVDSKKSPTARGQSLLSLLFRFAVTGGLAIFVCAPLVHEHAIGRWSPRPSVEVIIDCGVLWTLMDFIFAIQGLLSLMLGFPSQPSMRNPLASTSLREFWAHRWNIPTSSVLRSTCYVPILRLFTDQKEPPSSTLSTDVVQKISAATEQTPQPSQSTFSQTTAASSDVIPAVIPAVSSTPHQTRYNLRSRATATNSTKVPPGSSVTANGVTTPIKPSSASNVDGELASFPVATMDSDCSGWQPDSSQGKKPLGSSANSKARLAVARALGSCLAFFVSGMAHHGLMHLFSGMPLHDVRFAMLFWIQPLCIGVQDAWLRSSWWRSMQQKQPTLSWLTQWSTTLIVFLVQIWYLMRNPFLDNAGGRAYVQASSSEIAAACAMLLPSNDALCATSPPLIKALDDAATVVTGLLSA